MTRSPYAVTSALVVACPGCKAPIGKRCVAKAGYDMQHCHSTRRRLADEQRTREVNSKLLPPLEHDYIPIREPLPQRIPDLCPDDELRAFAKRAAPLPFFPNGAIALVQEAIRRTGLNRRNVRVEWIAEHATVKAFVSHVNADDIDAIMEQAIFIMPLGIGIDVQPETP